MKMSSGKAIVTDMKILSRHLRRVTRPEKRSRNPVQNMGYRNQISP